MQYGCIGEHLQHSLSPEIHQSLGRYSYILQEIEPTALDAFLQKRDFLGINVTMPYKQTVLPYLSAISPRAKVIGAVNTVVNRQGELYGDNTDFDGLKALIRHMGLTLEGKKVLIWGSGGTSRTAMAVAEDGNARAVYRVSRTGREGALTYEEAYTLHHDAEILIHTTPSGMYPQQDTNAVALDRLPALEGVVDVVYRPLRTKLVQEAQKRGIVAQGGLYMLVAQAVMAAQVFLGEPFPQEIVEQTYQTILHQNSNLVLIGMPNSGKTTIGKDLAEKLGRPFWDTDQEIEQKIGEPIPSFLRREGEERFRRIEAEVIAAVSQRIGGVIATGGGAILRQENVEALQQNGRLLYLHRSLDEIQPSEERPLSDTQEKLQKLYEERVPLYRKVAQKEIDPNDTIESIVKQLW